MNIFGGNYGKEDTCKTREEYEQKKKEILDIWYLFPLNALTRNLPKQKNLTQSTSDKIDRILGTHDWENALYQLDAQFSLFGDSNYTRVDFNELVNFVTLRLKENFPYVSPKSRVLKNSKNIVTVFPDDNKKYLSTKLSNPISNNSKFVSNRIELLEYQFI